MSQAFASVSYVAWLAWTSDLVPDEIRGTFFGTRNMLCGVAGIAAVLIFGNLVDVFRSHAGGSAFAIGVPFSCAVLFGLISARYLNRVSETGAPSSCTQNMLHELIKPFRETNFRNFLFFNLAWNFSVYLSAPFFALYFLRELNYSYGFVALLTTISAVVDLVGMKFWGAVSDRVKNRAVIQVAGWGVVMLPSMWVMVRPHDVLLPMLIQAISGGFWAGVNLCIHNMNLRISPRESRVWFISAYNITSGLGAAMAPVIAGAVLSMLPSQLSGPGGMTILPLHYLFFASTVLRVVSLLVFRSVHEPQEATARELLALLSRSARPALAKAESINSVHP
ncbi:MAG: MFS transporter [Desulfobacterales bacterium]|nr:MFS transporter [Desulfobacterales bacterium]